MTHRSTWKKQELNVAKALGGTRSPNSGNCLTDRTDVQGVTIKGHDVTISCKYQAKMQVATLYKEVQENAKKVKRLPMLLLKTRFMQGQLVVLSLKDFLMLVDASDLSPTLETKAEGLITIKKGEGADEEM